MIGQRSTRQRLGWPIRCSLLIAAAGLAGLLGLARRLEPDPRGFGTHTQLGLRPCAFAGVTGRLCPTCGMTTSYAWLTRGRLGRSWGANPAGCVIALLSVPVVVWLVASAARGEPVGFRSLAGPAMGLVVAAVVLSLVVWLVRLIVSPALPTPSGPSPGTAAGVTGL